MGKVQKTLYIDPDVHKALKEYAKSNGLILFDLVNRIISEYIREDF